MQIQKLTESETPDAMNLVWEVFLQFEAPEYPEEGIRNFKNVIDNQDIIHGFALYGAFENKKLAGVAATRNEGSHIALFFVRSDYHRRGIGRKLFDTVLRDSTSDRITVNSSPFAVEIYRRLGFAATDGEKLLDGIRYTPMEYIKNKTRIEKNGIASKGI
ncbi:hypothetical protein SDC9_43969 [bioreactor metagenome]|uniref:N-acetyltransferase domain-containing protein n=1 Tax=bioreactor metagenome TaxID=1076179 RepID=A0A644W229_9ZZZZ